MAEEHKSTEDLLKDYAARRKEAAGNPEMHPVTRKMLQGEVGRIYGKKEESKAAAPGGSWILQLWPRLVFGLVMLGFLVVAVVMSQPGRETGQVALARKESVDQEVQIEALDKSMPGEEAEKKKLAEADSKIQDTTERVQQVERDLLVAKEEALATPAPSAPAPQPIDQKNTVLKDVREVSRDEAPGGALAAVRPQPSAPPARENIPLRPEPASEPEVAMSPIIAPAQKAVEFGTEKQDAPEVRSRATLSREIANTSKTESRENADRVSDTDARRADGQTQWYYFRQIPQNFRRNFQSPPRQVVLSNFTMQIAGQQVTIFDESGSAFQGQVSGKNVEAAGVKQGTGEQVKISGTLEGLEQATNVLFKGKATVGETTFSIQAIPRGN